MGKEHIEQAGGIVLNQAGQVLMVKALSNMWTFPKGAVKKPEDLLETARREIEEETGITRLSLIKKLGSYERPGYTKENTETLSVTKRITLYLFRTDQDTLSVIDDGTLAAEWVDPSEVAGRLSHPKDRDFFLRVKDFLGV